MDLNKAKNNAKARRSLESGIIIVNRNKNPPAWDTLMLTLINSLDSHTACSLWL